MRRFPFHFKKDFLVNLYTILNAGSYTEYCPKNVTVFMAVTEENQEVKMKKMKKPEQNKNKTKQNWDS